MDFLSDPAEMTAEERFLELAAILARGYLRLRKADVLPVIATRAKHPNPPLFGCRLLRADPDVDRAGQFGWAVATGSLADHLLESRRDQADFLPRQIEAAEQSLNDRVT